VRVDHVQPGELKIDLQNGPFRLAEDYGVGERVGVKEVPVRYSSKKFA
jgi:hypothetical protein